MRRPLLLMPAIVEAGDDEESSEPSIAAASKTKRTALEFENEAFARLQARNSDRKLEAKAKRAEKAAKTKEEIRRKRKRSNRKLRKSLRSTRMSHMS